MTYSKLVDFLEEVAEESFANFQRKLIFTKYKILGVRTPMLRTIAKRYQSEWKDILTFPNEYYEVVFLKLTMISKLPFEQFAEYLPSCISLMDNWALCDQMKAPVIKKNRERFLPILEEIFQTGGEYGERYVLVTLLSYYVEDNYLPILRTYMHRSNTNLYYIHMAVAWLLAEILIKKYDFGLQILQGKELDVKTHNKAIQKGIESYRITQLQKEQLRSLKIKEKSK